MSKTIVILLDGTSNQIAANRTNVLRLYGALEKSDQQLVYYDPGVGTLAADGVWLRWWSAITELWGRLTGWGIDENVKEAYRFIVENYNAGDADQAKERDRICIIGFSRGAYTARILAGFIHAFGLIEKRNLNLLDYGYRAYRRIGESGNDNAFAEIRLYERMLAPDRPPIRLLALFDTVASVIELNGILPRLKSHAFVSRNPSVEAVRHAVAIDERRTMFNPLLWPPDQVYRGNPFNVGAEKPQDVKEVWFAGHHGDVGGGHPEAESALAKVPLAWMINETKALGLLYRTTTVNRIVLGQNTPKTAYVAPDPLAPVHDAMTPGWAIMECVPRRKPALSRRWSVLGWTIPFFEPRRIPEGALVHSSVEQRIRPNKQKPENLPANFTIV